MTNNVLVEVNEILGNTTAAAAARRVYEPSVLEAAVRFLPTELEDIEYGIIEALTYLQWEEVADVATLALLPLEIVEQLVESRATNGTRGFRQVWNQLTEDVEVPDGLSRSGFMLVSKISDDPKVIKMISEWAATVLLEAGEKTKKQVSKKTAVKEVLIVGDKVEKVKKARADAKAYLSPHKDSTDKPNAKDEIETAPHFVEPSEKDKEQAKNLKMVEKIIKKMTAMAKKIGKLPEEAFPNIWRDVQRERVRYS